MVRVVLSKMVRDSMTEFLDHWTACPDCRPRHDRYCEIGRELWVQEQVRWFLAQTDETKRIELAAMQKNNPKWHGVVRQRVVEAYNAQKRDTGGDQCKSNVYVLHADDR